MKPVLYIVVVVVSIAPIATYWFLVGNPVHQFNPSDLMAWATLYGLLISFGGLTFSAIAAVEVYGISARYRSKIRLPAEKRKINVSATKLSEASNENSRYVLAQALCSELLISIASIKSLSSGAVKQKAKKAQKLCTVVQKWAYANQANEQPIQSCEQFYRLYETVRELILEIDNAIADERAR